MAEDGKPKRRRQLDQAKPKPLWAITLPAGLLLHRRDLREMQAQ